MHEYEESIQTSDQHSITETFWLVLHIQQHFLTHKLLKKQTSHIFKFNSIHLLQLFKISLFLLY